MKNETRKAASKPAEAPADIAKSGGSDREALVAEIQRLRNALADEGFKAFAPDSVGELAWNAANDALRKHDEAVAAAKAAARATAEDAAKRQADADKASEIEAAAEAAEGMTG